MVLSLHEAADLLGISPATVKRWARQGLLGTRLPGEREMRFERRELEAWASQHGLSLKGGSTVAAPVAGDDRPLLQALQNGGVVEAFQAEDRASVLEALVARATLEEEVDREALLRELLDREGLSTTGLGHGVALPHPRTPNLAFSKVPCVHLAYLDPPVDWQAVDHEDVHTVLLLLSPTPRQHLQVLARVAYLLRQESFLELLARRGSREDLDAALAELEPVRT